MNSEWLNIQEALFVTFQPVIGWLAALMVASGFLSGAYMLWLGFLRWITRPR